MEQGSRSRALGRALTFAVPIVIVGTLLSVQDSSRAPSDVAFDAPDLFADMVRITEFDDRGEVLYGMEAKRLEHFEAAQSTRLDTPSMKIHVEDAPPWHVAAMTGAIQGSNGRGGNARNSVVTLENNVILRQQYESGHFVMFATEQLTLHPERRYAFTDRSVIITTGSTVSHGVGLEVDLEQSRFLLSSDPDDRGSVIIQVEP